MPLDWEKYMEIADKFQQKARYGDREDLRQDIILRLAEAGSNDGHKPDNDSWMYRIASFTIAQYWGITINRLTVLIAGIVAISKGRSVKSKTSVLPTVPELLRWKVCQSR